jgi:hypothetical protein
MLSPVTSRKKASGEGLGVQVHAQDPDAAGARRVALQVPLLRQRLQMLGHRLRALDPELLADLPDGGLVGVRAQIEHHVVQDLLLEVGQR